MARSSRIKKIVTLSLTLLPLAAMAADFRGSSGVRFGASIFSVVNLILFVTGVVSIRQLFWPGYENRLPFHIFNIVFMVVFYGASLPFLVANREYYVGYEHLSPLGVLGKFFFTPDITSFAQWVIAIAFVCNILYITRNYKDYFQAGLVKDAADSTPYVEEGEPVETDADAIP